MADFGILLAVVQRFGDPADHVHVSPDVDLQERMFLRIEIEISIVGNGSERRGAYEKLGVGRSEASRLPETAADEILSSLGIFRRQRRRFSVNDGGELSEHIGVRLGRIGVVTDGEFDDRES